MLDVHIYKVCRHGHQPFTGNECPECHRQRSRRDRERKHQSRVIAFEQMSPVWEGNPAFIPARVRCLPCIVPVKADGSLAYRKGNGYPYIWIKCAYYPLWQLIYFAVKDELPPDRARHLCARRYCVSLNHLEFPEAPITSTYKRKVRHGSIIINNDFPFTLKEWLEYQEQRLTCDSAGKDHSAGYLAKLNDLRTAYIPPTNS